MKRLFLPLLLGASTFTLLQPIHAAVLSGNNNIVTGIGNGFNGANTSAVAATSTTFGYSDNSVGTSAASLADDFTLSSNSLVSSVSFFSYSTSTYPSPPVSPFTGATLSLWNAQPGTAGASVLFSSTTIGATGWTGAYRVASTTLTNAQRPVFFLTLDFPNVALNAGTYWASWAVTGVASPGVSASVFNPPLMNADGTQPAGNAIQSTNGGVTWIATTDASTLVTNGLPLTVNGTVVPEPSTVTLFALVGATLTAAAAVRRRSRA